MKIGSISQQVRGELKDAVRTDQPSGVSFSDELKSKLLEVDRAQHESSEAMMKSALNGGANIHETMIQMEEAGISRQLLVKVRSKAIEAYQEVMRIQL